MHYSLSVLRQHKTIWKTCSHVKWIVWEDAFHRETGCIIFFCNRVMMFANVSNLVLWARIKKKREVAGGMVTSLFCCHGNISLHTKMLADEDDDAARWREHKLVVMMLTVTNQWQQMETREKICKYIYQVLYQRDIWINWMRERDASVDCVIVLYDWKLIIYSLVPARLLLLCLPCYCCHTSNSEY